jgi:RNA polymerase sigma-70 factor (ECF subfamily)
VTAAAERQAGALMQQAQQGDQQAYASLLAQLTTVARAYAHARVGDVPWAEDVVQETLITVHRARHTYDPGRPFAPWFYAIASSRLVDVIRRERRIARREIATPVSSIPSPGWPERPAIDVSGVRTAVAALPWRQRQIIVQTKFEERSVREVADRLRMSQSAVKVAAHRAYKALRLILRGHRGH